MNQLNRDHLRHRVEEAVKAERRNYRLIALGVNLAMFILFMAVAWGMSLLTPSIRQALNDPHPALLTVLIMLTVGWGTTIFFQALSVLMESGFMNQQFRDRATARVLREQIFEEEPEKAKNQPPEYREPVALSDDGELLPASNVEYKTSSKGSIMS